MLDKTLRQRNSIVTTADNHYNGILNLCIRFGKTRVGLLIAQEYMNKFKARVIVLVPSLAIKETWLAEKDKCGITEDIIIITIGSLVGLNNTINVNLLIVDECHRFTSDIWYQFINGNRIKYDNIVMLSGSLPSGDKLNMLTKIAPIIDTITEQEAMENQWVSEYIEFNIPLEFSESDKNKYSDLTKVISLTMNKYRNLYKYIQFENEIIFRDDLDLILACNDGKNSKAFGHISSESIRNAISSKMNNADYWTPDEILTDSIYFKQAMDRRNVLMASNKMKLDAVLYIVSLLDTSILCFSEFTNFADTIAISINKAGLKKAVSYHNKVKSAPLIDPTTNTYFTYSTGLKANEPKLFSAKKQLEYYIAAFNARKLDLISAVKSLDEGVTIETLDAIIITSGSQNVIQYKQRTGRGKTYKQDKVTRIYNLYFEDFYIGDELVKSRDKAKLYSRQFNSENIKNISILDVF
jgi:superfamily II DNA or RNA helicase